MKMEDILEIRSILRGWCTYECHYNAKGEWMWSGPVPIKVDELSDAEILEIAERIANQPPRDKIIRNK